MTEAESFPTSAEALFGARLALDNAERLFQAGRRLERPPVALGPAIAMYVTAIEEAAKATGWALFALLSEKDQSSPDAARAMKAIRRSHRPRLLVASLLDAANTPIALMTAVGVLLLLWLFRKEKTSIDAEKLLQVLKDPPEGALGRYEGLWPKRQQGLYVDWDSSGWRSPQGVIRSEAADVRRLASEYLKLASSFVARVDAGVGRSSLPRRPSSALAGSLRGSKQAESTT